MLPGPWRVPQTMRRNGERGERPALSVLVSADSLAPGSIISQDESPDRAF